MNWNLKCRNCGFAFGASFPDDETEENKIEIRTCPCGTLMDITENLEAIVLGDEDGNKRQKSSGSCEGNCRLLQRAAKL